jgi:hypothetical protein
MGEIILKTEIRREVGWLYYCTTTKDGHLAVGRARMKRGGTKKKKKKK